MKLLRRILLAGVAAITLASPANAQLFGPGTIVFDPTAVGKLLQSIGIQGEQLQQLVMTVEGIVHVYEEAKLIYGSVNGLVHAEQWAAGLLSQAQRNPLPFSATSHPGWVGGFNDPTALPFGNQYMSANTIGGNASVYQNGSFVGGELLKAVRSISTMQALASNNVQSIESRIIGLADLFAHLASVGSIQETSSLKARLEAEANYAHAQKFQSQNLAAAAQQQLAVLEYNQRQWQFQDEANGLVVNCQALASSGNPMSLPECSGSRSSPNGSWVAMGGGR